MIIPIQVGINGEALLGVVEIPQKNIDAIVILCYGLNGNRVEQHRMAKKMSSGCADRRILFLRFDFRNQGISDGIFDNVSLSQKKNDVNHMIDFIKGCVNDENIPIFLVGYSDGVKIVAMLLGERSDIDGIILWNPVFSLPIDVQKRKESKEKLQLHVPTRMIYQKLLGLRLNVSLIKEMKIDHTFEILTKYSKGILYIFGTEDRFTKELGNKIYKTKIYHEYTDTVSFVRGAAHIFGKTTYEQEVINKTIEWICEKCKKKFLE